MHLLKLNYSVPNKKIMLHLCFVSVFGCIGHVCRKYPLGINKEKHCKIGGQQELPYLYSLI